MNEWKKACKKMKKYEKYSSGELFNLDYTFSRFILPRLKGYKKIVKKYKICPVSFENYKEFVKILNKMILAFTIMIDNKYLDDYSETSMNIVQEGLDLFRKHFFSLWY